MAEQTAAQSIFTETDETKLPMTDVSGGTDVSGSRARRSSVGTYIGIILFLAALVALAWLFRRFLQRGSGSAPDDDTFLRRVSSLSLGPGRSVQIVTLVDKAYLLGVTDGAVSLLAEIGDAELVSAMNLYADKHGGTAHPKNFSDVLDLFMPRGKSGAGRPRQEGVFEDGSSRQILDSLKRQSKRLSDEG